MIGQENRKIRTLLKQKVTVSLKIPLLILIILFGMLPMMFATQTAIISMEQNQTDSRVIEVQNRCQILSNKMTRSGYFLA